MQCRRCGHIVPELEPIQDAGNLPSPGDIVICWGCSAVARFTMSMELVPLTEREVLMLVENDDRVVAALSKALESQIADDEYEDEH